MTYVLSKLKPALMGGESGTAAHKMPPQFEPVHTDLLKVTTTNKDRLSKSANKRA